MRKYIKNGYVMIYLPDHHRAEENGLVYEHVYLAEKYIGRKLKDEEIVHHEDRNRSNNSEDNLFVFKTIGDHNRYHATGLMISVGDGSYTSPIKKIKCKQCDNYYDKTGISGHTYCSTECYNLSMRKSERPSRDELFLLIKTIPFVEIGNLYGVSDNAIRKWCKSYDLPYRKKDLKTLDKSVK